LLAGFVLAFFAASSAYSFFSSILLFKAFDASLINLSYSSNSFYAADIIEPIAAPTSLPVDL
jgi:hypothetical protein